MPSILELPHLVESLPEEKRRLFHRLFRVSLVTGYLEHPRAMHPWVKKQFGSLENVTCQDIVKVINLITFEGALFNPLRSSRPLELKTRLEVEALVFDESKNDPLDDPENLTPKDTFGRVRGKYCITASNIAKYDALHGIVIFDQHNPLGFTRDRIIDYLDTAWQWALLAHREDPEAKYFFFMWNCLWKAGASLHHGHAQVMLTRDSHYAKVEGLRRAALTYKERYGSSYFDDLFQAHQMVGCALERDGVRLLAYLTPIKDKEVMLLSPELNLPTKEAIADVLICFRDRMNVTSFNLMLTTPPLTFPLGEDWEGFPVLARAVDRGDPKVTASDIGAMELYASSVVASDPLEVATLLRESLEGR